MRFLLKYKFFEAALALSALMIIAAIGIYDYLHPSSMAREAVVQHARNVSVKVIIPGGGHGSGVVLTEDGRIVTNQHVCGKHSELHVERTDGTVVRAKVLWHAIQTEYDLCLIQAESETVFNGLHNAIYKWEYAEFSTAHLFAGLPVFHIGNMMAVRELISFGTLGKLEALGWNEQPAYSYIGVAGPGSSGGGLFDLEGKLIGLVYSGHQVVAGSGRGFGGVRIPLGVAHILPADFIQHLLGR